MTGAVLDQVGLEVFQVGDVFLDVFHKLQPRIVRVHVQRHRQALCGVEGCWTIRGNPLDSPLYDQKAKA